MSIENLTGKKLKNFSVIGVLGSGSYAVVYQATQRTTEMRVAIKAIPIKLIKEKRKLKQLVETQIKVLKSCHNENVIRHIDSFKSPSNVFIVTQFCNGGDVQAYLNNRKRLSEDQATDILKQILNGFKGLHQVKAMHRDFKLANLLLHNKNIKIADLGFAKQLDKNQSLTKTQLGTGLTMAPQVLDGKQYGMYADIWSIGVVYYQMLYGVYPFNGSTDEQIRKRIQIRKIQYPNSIKISQNAKDFIERCLTIDPRLRISWSQIYSHPLLSKQTNLLSSTSISKINLQKNRVYYMKNEVQAQKKFMYPEKQQFITEGYEIKEMKAEQLKQQSNFQMIKLQNQVNKQKQNQVFQYEQILLKKRNNIMFMFKFFVPKIAPYIQQIRAIHNITLFFICKKTLIQMQHFINELNEKKSCKNDNSALKTFFGSKNCLRLLNVLLEDIDMIKQQSEIYMEDIQISSPDIECEMLDITKWNGQNWQLSLHQVLDQYWFQIAQNIDTTYAEKTFLQILRALQFYRLTDQVNTEVFEKILQTLNYEEYKEQIIRKLFESII